MTNKIWGIKFETLGEPDYPIWKLYINKPFMYEGKYQVGINRKLILAAQKDGVQRFIISINGVEKWLNVPNEKGLKMKDKALEFEDRKSLFQNGGLMRIYYFEI